MALIDLPAPDLGDADQVTGGPGVQSGPNVSGVAITGLISHSASMARVRLADGNTATIPASSPLYAVAITLPQEPAPVVVPAVVTNAQARAALRAAGLILQVEAAIAAADPTVMDAWEYSPTFSRSSVLVATLGSAIGLTPEQIDALFIEAASIQF